MLLDSNRYKFPFICCIAFVGKHVSEVTLCEKTKVSQKSAFDLCSLSSAVNVSTLIVCRKQKRIQVKLNICCIDNPQYVEVKSIVGIAS